MEHNITEIAKAMIEKGQSDTAQQLTSNTTTEKQMVRYSIVADFQPYYRAMRTERILKKTHKCRDQCNVKYDSKIRVKAIDLLI